MTTILDPIASKVLETLQSAEEASSQALSYVGHRLRLCIEVGYLLRQKKFESGHGEWLKWFEENVSNTDVAERAAFSYQTARKWMRLSEINENGILDLDNAGSVRQAYILAGLLPASDSNTGTHDDSNAQCNILVKIKRIETLLQSELTRRPLKSWSAQERSVWRDRLKPLANFYEQIPA